MGKSSQTALVWLGIALTVFAVFRWLFGLALPDAAMAFSLGITVILMSGMLSGWYASRAWFGAQEYPPKKILVALAGSVLSAFFGIGYFADKMIGDTQLFDFAMTILLLFILSASSAGLVNLIRIRTGLTLEAAQTAAAHSKSELHLLQSQLSPHFLFNTLNNVYGLSLSDPQKVPALLLKLSDLLRYSVYDAKELFVPLLQEVNYLNNYIEFEKVRLDDRLVLRSNLEETSKTPFKIAPMLLIVFVENAFKHARNTADEKIFIEIDLRVSGNTLIFNVRNSCFFTATQPGPEKKHSGFGLENVKKRLALLYRDSYQLNITKSEREFQVTLSLTSAT